MRCQLCAYEFDETQLRCHTSCPFNEQCAIICCPNCGYQTVDDSKSKLAETVRRLLQSRGKARLSTRPACCPLSQLHVGETGKLISIDTIKANRLERLQIFGLTPGATVALKQRYPEFVLEVGHTELTVERDVAADILVEVLNPA